LKIFHPIFKFPQWDFDPPTCFIVPYIRPARRLITKTKFIASLERTILVQVDTNGRTVSKVNWTVKIE